MKNLACFVWLKLLLLFLPLLTSCLGTSSSLDEEQEVPSHGQPTVLSTGLPTAAKVIRVKIKSDPSPSPDGTTWDKAYSSLEDALDAHKDDIDLILAVSANSVVRAKAISSDPLLHLAKFSGTSLSILGGFKGNETDFSSIEGQGDYPAHPLIIDGDDKNQIFLADFNTVDPARKIKLFGMQLRDGNTDSTGAAISIKNSTLELDRTQWIKNKAQGAGAIFAVDSEIRIVGPTRFELNEATSGGAITALKGKLIFDAVTEFVNNKARGNGGAIRAYDTIITVNKELHFRKNSAVTGGSAIWSNKALLGNTDKIKGAKKESGGEGWGQI